MGGEVPRESLAALREKIDKLAEEAPNVSSRIWTRTKEYWVRAAVLEPEENAPIGIGRGKQAGLAPHDCGRAPRHLAARLVGTDFLGEIAVMPSTVPRGTVYFIGAGPGDPDLITVRGRALIERARSASSPARSCRGPSWRSPAGAVVRTRPA